MTKCKLEYIWLDGYQPDPEHALRTRHKIVEDFKRQFRKTPSPASGRRRSSTQTAPGGASGLPWLQCHRFLVVPDPDRYRAAGFLVHVRSPHFGRFVGRSRSKRARQR